MLADNQEQQFNAIKEAIKKSTNINELMCKLNTISDDNKGRETKLLVDHTRNIKRDYPETDIVFIERPDKVFDVCARGALPFIIKYYKDMKGCTLHYVARGINS